MSNPTPGKGGSYRYDPITDSYIDINAPAEPAPVPVAPPAPPEEPKAEPAPIPIKPSGK